MLRKKNGSREVPRRRTICNGLESSESSCRKALSRSFGYGMARQKCVAFVPVKMQARLPRVVGSRAQYGAFLFYLCTPEVMSACDSAEAQDSGTRF